MTTDVDAVKKALDDALDAWKREQAVRDAAFDMLQALHLVGMSAGWQYMAFETREIVQAAIDKAEGRS